MRTFLKKILKQNFLHKWEINSHSKTFVIHVRDSNLLCNYLRSLYTTMIDVRSNLSSSYNCKQEREQKYLRERKESNHELRMLNWINEALGANPSYLRLHHNTMWTNWNQYIECTSMRVEILNINLNLEWFKKNLPRLCLTHEILTQYNAVLMHAFYNKNYRNRVNKLVH